MDFFTVSTFRETLSNLTKKPRDGYMSVVKDICNNLQKMNDDILRNTNDRVKQYTKYRIVKLRVAITTLTGLPRQNSYPLDPPHHRSILQAFR